MPAADADATPHAYAIMSPCRGVSAAADADDATLDMMHMRRIGMPMPIDGALTLITRRHAFDYGMSMMLRRRCYASAFAAATIRFDTPPPLPRRYYAACHYVVTTPMLIAFADTRCFCMPLRAAACYYLSELPRACDMIR